MLLNLDVFVQIMSQMVAMSDISMISRACRTLHAERTRELLKHGVSLCTKAKLSSFATFLETNPHWRVPLIKTLVIEATISDNAPSEHTTKFAEILQRCTSVESLSIRYGRVLDIDLRVGAALSRLEHVKYISIRSAEGVANLHQVLACMRSSCERIQLDYTIDDSRDDSDNDDYRYYNRDPLSVAALTPFASSLKVLILCCPKLLDHNVITTYSNLHTLILTDWQNYDLSPILRCMPNLRRMKLSYSFGTCRRKSRERNAAAAKRYHWSDLEYFEGPDIDCLYELGVTCPIGHWVLNRLEGFPDKRVLARRLKVILASIPLTRLSIYRAGVRTTDGLDLDDLLGILATNPPSSLTHLTLQHLDVSGYTPKNMEDLLVSHSSSC